MRYHLGAAFAIAVASVTPAMANVEVGQLECRGVSQQFIVGSVTNLQCLFRPSSGDRPQPYDAQIRRFGLDIGINQSTVLCGRCSREPAGTQCAERHLCRPLGQRHGWRRRRRQCAVGWLQPYRRAAAGERAGPDRPRRRRRRLGDGNARPPDAAARPSAAPSSPLIEFGFDLYAAADPAAAFSFPALARMNRATCMKTGWPERPFHLLA